MALCWLTHCFRNSLQLANCTVAGGLSPYRRGSVNQQRGSIKDLVWKTSPLVAEQTASHCALPPYWLFPVLYWHLEEARGGHGNPVSVRNGLTPGPIWPIRGSLLGTSGEMCFLTEDKRGAVRRTSFSYWALFLLEMLVC